MAIFGMLMLLLAIYTTTYGVLWVLSYLCICAFEHLRYRRRRRLGLDRSVRVHELLDRVGHRPVRPSGGRHRRKAATGRHVRVRATDNRATRGRPARPVRRRTPSAVR